MNIVSIIFEFSPNINGGVGRYSEYYSKYILKRKHNLHIITYNEKGELPTHEDKGALKIYRPKRNFIQNLIKNVKNKFILELEIITFLQFITFFIDTFFTIKKILKKNKVDVICVHDWLTCIPGILSKLFLKLPLIFHVHSTELTMTNHWGSGFYKNIINYFEKKTGKLADKIIVASDHMKQILTKNGWDEKKINIIHCGINTNINTKNFKKAIKNKTDFFKQLFNNISDQSKFLVYAGRLYDQKGIFNLIEAFNILKNVDQTIKLIVLGLGDNLKVQELIKKYNLEKNIFVYYKFLNFHEVMQHFYFADICIFPSLYEPFGIVALESMLLGTPTILGHGFSNIFFGTAANPTACKVNADSPDDIAEKILFLNSNPKVLKKLSLNGKKIALKFDQEKLIYNTIDLYNQTINKNS